MGKSHGRSAPRRLGCFVRTAAISVSTVPQGQRVRPKMMTVCAIMAGLLPIMWSHGTGAEVMQRIAVPMIGGMVSSTLLTLIVIPAIYALLAEVGARVRRPLTVVLERDGRFPPMRHLLWQLDRARAALAEGRARAGANEA